MTTGHEQHGHRSMIEDFRKRLIISLVLTLPLLALSPLLQQLLGYSLSFSYAGWLSLLLSAVLYGYGAWPFLSGMVRELKQRLPGMMTLIGVAVTVAFAYSAATVFGLSGEPFFWELATLI